jgi:hypothetical protein
MALTISIIVLASIFGIVGFMRGTRRGIVTLVGTLFGAVLVDLWQDRWAEWLRTERGIAEPATATFAITAIVFVLVALVIGYGGSTLLRKDPKATSIGFGDRLLGSLVGALNAGLIVSYLLRYAEDAWTDGTATALIAASPVATILAAWLAWFVLALVITTSIFALIRVTITFSQALSSQATLQRQRAERQQQEQQTRTLQGTQSTSTAKNNAPATPATRAEADKQVLDKINQRTGGG